MEWVKPYADRYIEAQDWIRRLGWKRVRQIGRHSDDNNLPSLTFEECERLARWCHQDVNAVRAVFPTRRAA